MSIKDPNDRDIVYDRPLHQVEEGDVVVGCSGSDKIFMEAGNNGGWIGDVGGTDTVQLRQWR